MDELNFEGELNFKVLNLITERIELREQIPVLDYDIGGIVNQELDIQEEIEKAQESIRNLCAQLEAQPALHEEITTLVRDWDSALVLLYQQSAELMSIIAGFEAEKIRCQARIEEITENVPELCEE